jgi:alpha-L-rhamnosidase
VIDLGQNIVGRVRLTLRGFERGTVVRMQHAEALNEDGSVYLANLRSTRQEDAYVASGADEERYEPTFTVHGFRYLAVRGLGSQPSLQAITGVVIHNDLPETSSFESSSALLNQLHANIVWGQRGNFVAVPTDCPQRDERMGWTGDAQLFARTAAYNMDIEAFFGKWVVDILDAQSDDGAFQNIAPCAPFPGGGTPAWGDAGVILPLTLYELYGDERLLRRCYPAMRSWMDYIERNNPGGLRERALFQNFGDWLSLDADTPKVLLATAYYAWQAKLMAQAARALGIAEDEMLFEALFRKIRAVFNEAFVAENGMVAGDTQTGFLLALFVGLLPDDRRRAAVAALIDNIERRGGRLTTGFVGVRHLCPILSEFGHHQWACRLALSEDYPSWGYSIRQGATTIWERWDGWTREHGFQSPKMNSFNHFALGSVGEWLFEYVAGIGDDRSGGAFKHIRLRPMPGPGVDWCRASYRSIRGLIESYWRIEGGDFLFDCTIPANTSASVELPFRPGARVELDGIDAAPQIRTPEFGEPRAVLTLDSGRYEIRVRGAMQR